MIGDDLSFVYELIQITQTLLVPSKPYNSISL